MTTTPATTSPCTSCPSTTAGRFQTKMFGWKGALTAEQTAEIAAMKQVIYDGFKAALAGGVPKDKAGILVDEQFGADDPPRRAGARLHDGPAPPRRAARTSSTSSTATTSPSTSRRSTRPSARCWCATTPRATRR